MFFTYAAQQKGMDATGHRYGYTGIMYNKPVSNNLSLPKYELFEFNVASVIFKRWKYILKFHAKHEDMVYRFICLINS